MKFCKDKACNSECGVNGCTRSVGTICSLGNNCCDCESDCEFIEKAMSDNWDDNGEGDTCGFGVALALMKAGEKMRRRGWNGKGTFIKIQFPDEHSKMTSPYIYIDTTGLESDNPDAPRSCVPWLASQTDMLAEDWEIYGVEE